MEEPLFLYSRKISEHHPDERPGTKKGTWLYVVPQMFNTMVVRGPHYSFGWYEDQW